MVQFQSKGWQPGDPDRLMVQMKSEGSLLENSLLLQETSFFVLFRPSADWVRPTHIMEGTLLIQSLLIKC